MIDAHDVNHELVAVANALNVKTVREGLWMIDWLSSARRPLLVDHQARLFSYLLSLTGEFLLDTEETKNDCPVRLLRVDGVEGVAHLGLLRPPADYPALLRWLERQQWLALGYAPSDTKPSGRLQWTTDKFFKDPLELAKLLRQTGASLALLSYYDGDAWLLAVRTEMKVT